jgi:hypothetical protein
VLLFAIAVFLPAAVLIVLRMRRHVLCLSCPAKIASTISLAREATTMFHRLLDITFDLVAKLAQQLTFGKLVNQILIIEAPLVKSQPDFE